MKSFRMTGTFINGNLNLCLEAEKNLYDKNASTSSNWVQKPVPIILKSLQKEWIPIIPKFKPISASQEPIFPDFMEKRFVNVSLLSNRRLTFQLLDLNFDLLKI